MWPTDLVRRRSRLDQRTAVLLSLVDHQREVVAARCAIATKAGVAPGMTVAQARALLPPKRTLVESLDPDRCRRSLRRLAEWAIRFTPTVALDEPDGLLLDATGCERLYGGIRPLVRRVHKGVTRLGFAARIAAAPTWGTAWAVARFGERDLTVVSRESLAETLSHLPIAALRVESEVVDMLARLGVETIGQLTILPRSSLAARYGPDLLLRLDQALGQAIEIIRPVRPRPPVMAEQMLDGPTDHPEAVELVSRELLEEIVSQLARRESGCRELRVRLLRSDLDPVDLAVRTSRPTREAKHLWSMLRPKLERAHLGFGVEGIVMHAATVARMPHEQASRWNDDRGTHDDAEVGRLVDTLIARLGPENVLRIEPVESHLPERSFRFEPVASLDDLSSSTATLTDLDRPSRLLDEPVHIEAMLLDPDGPIITIRLGVGVGARTHTVLSSIGPDRIKPEWWQGDRSVRDYFKVQTESGRWLWVFRDWMSRRWFLHGEWA